jgi:2-isopropylmalate synthase
MATALALAGVENGATQMECTINGLGERAGNTAIEEVVMAIKMHGDELDAHTDINPKEITRASRLVSITGFRGAAEQGHRRRERLRAFSSGIHQDGVLKNRDDLRDHRPRGRRRRRARSSCPPAAATRPCASPG